MKKLEEIEKVLIIVDMVNGFVKEGNMSTPYMKRLIPEIDKLIKQFNKENEGLIFIKESHDKDCTEFNKFPEHCVEGTYEAQIIDEFETYVDDEGEFTFEKNSTCAIFAPGFMNAISKMKSLKEVVIVGGCTDICVMNLAIPLVNYFDQENKDIKLIIPENAVDTYDAPNHNRDEYNEMAYKFMRQAGVQIVKKYK